jgi:protein O-GlcNAc transferase
VNPLISSFVVADVLFLVNTWTSGHVEAAIKSYKQALVLRADFPEATCNLLHTLQCVCDWDDRDDKFIEIEAVVRRQIKVIALLPSF